MSSSDQRKKRRLSLESLESRRSMAADISLSGGVLRITGTDSDDQISLEYTSSQIIQATVKDTQGHVLAAQMFVFASIRSYYASGLLGNDVIANRTNRPGTMEGGFGDDTLQGGSSADTLMGQQGDDVIAGGAGADRLDGGTGADFLDGEAGADRLIGGEGDDVLFGGADNDSLHGNRGLDTLWGGSGNDKLFGDEDMDELFGELGNDELHGGDGDDKLQGNEGNDVLFGDNGKDRIDGGSGNDSIWGGYGHDIIRGGTGNDFLAGGPRVTDSQGAVIQDGDDDYNRDLLFGDEGADTFEIDKSTRLTWKFWKLFSEEYNRDDPVDFTRSEGDRFVNWY